METNIDIQCITTTHKGVGDAVGVGKIKYFHTENGYHRMRSSECLKWIMKFTVNTPNTGNDQKKVKSSSIL